MKDFKTLGTYLLWLRCDQFYKTQVDMAKMIGISSRFYNRLENDKLTKVSIRTLNRLSKFLGYSQREIANKLKGE